MMLAESLIPPSVAEPAVIGILVVAILRVVVELVGKFKPAKGGGGGCSPAGGPQAICAPGQEIAKSIKGIGEEVKQNRETLLLLGRDVKHMGKELGRCTVEVAELRGEVREG